MWSGGKGSDRVLVALTGGPEGEVLLRHAFRLHGAELHSVYVADPGPGGAPDPAALVRLRGLTEDLGGVHHTVTAADPAQAASDVPTGQPQIPGTPVSVSRCGSAIQDCGR